VDTWRHLQGRIFLDSDLPADQAARDRFPLRVMGSPDPRQIDGMGGADPLSSKVAVISRSERDGVDIDHLFVQVFVDPAIVTDGRKLRNMLAGAAPFAIERGLVAASDGETRIAIYMRNTGQVAIATVCTPAGRVTYEGDAAITGVPGTGAPIPLIFRDTAGSTSGALLPTGRVLDEIVGIAVTLIDNGMPCVILHATDVGLAGTEDCDTLNANTTMKARMESIPVQAGPLMNLGDVGRNPCLRSCSWPPPGPAAPSACAP
jgi:4-oxalomesaconate tautomerase